MTRWTAGSLFLVMGAALLVAGSGCDDPVDLCEPQVAASTVKGRVRSAGLPLPDSYVTARKIEEDSGLRGEFQVVPDEEGFYSLDLPAGRFVFRLDLEGGHYDFSEAGLGYGQSPPDTILIGSGNPVPAIDFNLGGVRLGMDVPDQFHGKYGEVRLQPTTGDSDRSDYRVTEARAEIVSGRFEVELAGVLPGGYRVEVALGCTNPWCGSSSPGERFWLPGTHDPAASPLYVVAADSVLELGGEITGEPARIEGTVTGAWLDMGLANEPQISIVTEDSLQTLSSFSTREDGRFSAEFMIPDRVKILVSQSRIDYWIGGPDFAGATVYDLEAGGTISDIVHDQCGIHLVVDETGLPLGNGEIRVYNKADLSLVGRVSGGGSSAIHKAVPNLWPGEFVLHVDHDFFPFQSWEWRPQWFDRAATVDLAQPVSLAAAGQVARLNLILEMGGKISGRLDTGASEGFYKVMLYRTGEDSPLWQTYASRDIYLMSGLPDGDYQLGAALILPGTPEGDTYWYPGSYDRSAAQIIEIRDASVVEDVDIVIPQ